MKVTYDPKADVLCLVLRDEPPLDAVGEPSGVVVSYGEEGEPESVELLNAAARNLTPADELRVTVQTSSPRPKTATS